LLSRYEFEIEFDIPITYPKTAPEIGKTLMQFQRFSKFSAIPSLDGKTAKMYRGGKICLSDHFKPLWARNVPKFGIAHVLTLGLGPVRTIRRLINTLFQWLAVEVPALVERGVITPAQN
jgi:ufm1-conjugating enzyme 1